MKIFLIRHGQDDERFKGGWSTKPLIKRGRIQVYRLSKYLLKRQNHFKIQKIISSDIVRAKQTANIINSKLKLPIEFTERLREMDNGHLRGLPIKKTIKMFPGVFFRNLKMNEAYPGGESPINFKNRIIKAFNEILEENKQYDTIAIVSHNAVIGLLYNYIKQIPWSNKIRTQKIDYASITIFKVEGTKKEVELVNFIVK